MGYSMARTLGHCKPAAGALRTAVTAGCIIAMAFWINASQTSGAKSASLSCDIGPINKTYGNTPWLVYSCDDGRSVVFVTAPDNPAMPFYFMISPGDNGYALVGEGNGDKAASAAVYEDLQALSERDIAKLIELTKRNAE